MQSYLITGGRREKQLEKVKEINEINSLNLSLDKFTFPSSHPDIYLVDPTTSSISIEEVRKIISFALLKPFSLSMKIIFIENAQKLTPQAQNSLLKLLEEPPPSCVFILTAASDSQLLPTVVSRCQLIESKSKITLPPEELKLIDQTLNALIKSPLGEALTKGEEISKSRAVAIETCSSLILFLEPSLYETSFPPLPQPQVAKSIRLLQSAIVYLNANVSPRLVIDQLILRLRTQA